MFGAHNYLWDCSALGPGGAACLLRRVWHPRDHASFTLERPASGPLAAGAGATVRPGHLSCTYFRISHDICLNAPGSHALLRPKHLAPCQPPCCFVVYSPWHRLMLCHA